MKTPAIDLVQLKQAQGYVDSEALTYLAAGIDDLKTIESRLTSAYDALTKTDDLETKRIQIVSLVKAVHQLKGTASYLPTPQLNQYCNDFHGWVKSYTAESESLEKKQNMATHYRQLLGAIAAVSTEFTTLSDSGLAIFLSDWTHQYQKAVSRLPLFQPELTKTWTIEQRQQFVIEFYHIRGHFYRLLWHLGNTAPNCEKEKGRILDNLKEEFGGNEPSHEQLYLNFAEALGVDNLDEEYITGHRQPERIRTYNTEHLHWFNAQSWPGKMAGFAAYERLDNVDYQYLLELGRSLEVAEEALIFFVKHNKADHFDQLHDALRKVWRVNPKQVTAAFEFIGSHQIAMWQQFSNALFD